jgi:hypothetical protein
MPPTLPVESDVAIAVNRATAARRRRHYPSLALNDMDESTLNAVVVGVVATVLRGEGGWWLVGYVIDGIAGEAFEIWLSPGCRNSTGAGVSALAHEWGSCES